MNCSKHPKYKAIHKPRVKCEKCWEMYEENHRKKLLMETNHYKAVVELSCFGTYSTDQLEREIQKVLDKHLDLYFLFRVRVDSVIDSSSGGRG